MSTLHWAESAANEIVETFPERDIYVIAAGASPSGVVHFGNFRDVITADAVVRVLRTRGVSAELRFYWDDYDRFRKVPRGLSPSLEEFIGHPLARVPDLICGEHDSYARHFETRFGESLQKIGVSPIFIYQHQRYSEGGYVWAVRTALQNRQNIANIVGFHSEEVGEEYFPVKVYCEMCNKDTTRILSYDKQTENLSYACKCGHRDEFDIKEKMITKLPWKVDWATRWKNDNISFEPGGKDHASAGGSFSRSSAIAEQVFRFTPPVFLPYEFIGIRGLTGKMSGSAGLNWSFKKIFLNYYSTRKLLHREYSTGVCVASAAYKFLNILLESTFLEI